MPEEALWPRDAFVSGTTQNHTIPFRWEDLWSAYCGDNSRSSWHKCSTNCLRVRNPHVTAYFASQMVRYFVVARHRGSLAIRRISPPSMVPTFADQFASVIHQMPYQIAAIHG